MLTYTFYDILPSEMNELIPFKMITGVYAEGYVMFEFVTMTIIHIHIHSIMKVELVFQPEILAPTCRSTWRRSSGERITSTDMRRLTTGMRSEEYVVRRFRRYANKTECHK